MKSIFGVRLEDELIKEIKIQAIKEDKNVNEIIEELLEDYLKKKATKEGE